MTIEDKPVNIMASNQTTGISVNLSTGEVNAGTVQFRNRIINGDMRIAQRGASISFSSGSLQTFCVDRFVAITNITTGAMTMNQVSLSTSDAPYQMGIQNSLRLTATTGLSSYVWCGLSQYIEDKNIADLNWGTSYGAPISVSFWIRANVPNGSLLGFNVRSGLFSVAYNVNIFYIQNNSWQFVTLLVPPPPAGTLWTSNGRGLQIYIAGNQNLQSQTAIEGWTTTGNLWGLTTTYKPFVVTGQWVEWTSVQLEKGPKATPFEFRPYPIELQLCQRYCELIIRGVWGWGGASGLQYATYPFKVTKRAIPTTEGGAIFSTIYAIYEDGISISRNNSTPDIQNVFVVAEL